MLQSCQRNGFAVAEQALNEMLWCVEHHFITMPSLEAVCPRLPVCLKGVEATLPWGASVRGGEEQDASPSNQQESSAPHYEPQG